MDKVQIKAAFFGGKPSKSLMKQRCNKLKTLQAIKKFHLAVYAEKGV